MSENENRPNGPRELGDDELKDVHGGHIGIHMFPYEVQAWYRANYPGHTFDKLGYFESDFADIDDEGYIIEWYPGGSIRLGPKPPAEILALMNLKKQ